VSENIPIEHLSNADDCGFSPFSDDTSSNRDAALAKIEAHVLGAELAQRLLGACS
jgi:5-methyltetrahydropteroyltriglutamate--homocysteine methyltransferase